jgi:O-antigen ligase
MAFTSTPNMLGSILMVALLLKFTQLFKRKAVKKSEIAILGLCFLAFFIAISKTMLCFLFGFMALFFLFSKKRTILFKTFIFGSMVFLSLVYLIGSHFVFTSALSPRVLDNMEQGHITRIYHKIGPLIAIETSYLTIKSSCLQMLKRSWPWGIGTRNFKLQVPQLKEEGLYNKETMAFDPHCTPLGTITELGLLGGLVLLLFFGQICKGLMVIGREKKYPFHSLGLGLTAIFYALILESWVTDIMNFRHYWLLLAILAYMMRGVEKPETETRL